MKHPFAVPARLSPDLVRVQAYWKGLLRGGAAMPFWDDAKLSDLPDLVDRLFLIDVFDRPERFRFNTVGGGIAIEPIAGKFIDDITLDRPFEFLRSQCSATVEQTGPTVFRQGENAATPALPYTRLLLPMWGDGRIGMLLGAVDFG